MWLLAKSPSEVANTVVGNTPYHTQLTPHHILEHCSAEPGGHFVAMWRNAFLISLLLPSIARVTHPTSLIQGKSKMQS